MSRPLAVLRPEPGNSVTAGRIESLCRRALRIPLFETHGLAWEPPDPARFDSLMLTSANAVRHAGEGLAMLRRLPVLAVGGATAKAAHAADLHVAVTGTGDAEALIAQAEHAGFRHALHLAGRERKTREGGIIARIETVYASDPRGIAPEMLAELAGSIALIHSPRAGERLAQLVGEADRTSIAIAAISENAAAGVGLGWRSVTVAPKPSDFALIEAACALAD